MPKSIEPLVVVSTPFGIEKVLRSSSLNVISNVLSFIACGSLWNYTTKAIVNLNYFVAFVF